MRDPSRYPASPMDRFYKDLAESGPGAFTTTPHRTEHYQTRDVQPRPSAAQRVTKRTEQRVVQAQVSGLKSETIRPTVSVHDLRVRLDCVNLFLEDVYGESVRLSHVLIQKGFMPEQVKAWRHDQAWLTRFLEGFHHNLVAQLRTRFPDRNPYVLTFWYGLTQPEVQTVEAIATRLGMAGSTVHETCSIQIEWLRTQDGRRNVELAAVSAAKGHLYFAQYS